MGEVYLAQHPRLPRRDALKLLPREWSTDVDYRARFIREADLASTLWHPHIVGVHDRGETDGQLWISMDFVDGQDAAQLLATRYPAGMPAEMVARIVMAVASGLDAAHKQGLVHRDVKPANIMLTQPDEDGGQRILLADFGIAREFADVGGLTTTNMTVGTVAYCAPEQLLGEELDGRSDQYSLAATAFHLLTGAPLFSNSNPAVVISRHLNADPPLLSSVRPELAILDPVIAAGLAKRPDDRFSRCSEFANALSEQVGPVSAAPASVTTPAPVRSPGSTRAAIPLTSANSTRARRRTPWIVAAAVFAVLALLAGLFVVWRPWSGRGVGASSNDRQMGPVVSASMPPPVRATEAPTTTAARPKPAPHVFPPAKIDAVLPTAEQLSRLLSINVSADPASSQSALALVSSSYGTSDHASQVRPPSCVVVAFTGEQAAYKTSGFSALKTQIFGDSYRNYADRGPYLLQQTAAIFPSAEQAQSFLNSSLSTWQACATTEVEVTLGFENGRGWQLGKVTTEDNIIAVSMADNGALNGAHACQQAMGVRENVVVEARTCQDPKNAGGYDPVQGWEKDPNWAVPDAERVAKKMMDNVIP